MKAKLITAAKRFFSMIFSKIPKKYVYTVSAVLIAFAAYIIFKMAVHAAWVITSGEVEFVMEGRDRVVRDSGSSYELYTSVGVLTNQDSLFRLKRNSGDLQNELRPGRTYLCDTQGFRFRYFDLMQNVISCVEKKSAGEVAIQ
jgi:hypothetical protein